MLTKLKIKNLVPMLPSVVEGENKGLMMLAKMVECVRFGADFVCGSCEKLSFAS